jgi:hypothetical protein
MRISFIIVLGLVSFGTFAALQPAFAAKMRAGLSYILR